MGNKSLTVLMTVFNNSLFLRESIASILVQKEIEFDFLILDDGSDEDIAKIISEINDNRITFIKLNKIGLIAALNEGIKQCRTKYIAILDSDDIADENRLAKQLQFLENNPSIGLVGTSIKYITDGMKNSKWAVKMPETNKIITHRLKTGKFFMHHSTIMGRTSLFKKVGGYSEDSFPVPDLDIFLKICSVSELANLSDIYSYIRLHQNNFTIQHLKAIVAKRYLILFNKKPSMVYILRQYHTILNYRRGITNFLEKKYLLSLYHLFVSFLLSPIQSLVYIAKKMTIST